MDKSKRTFIGCIFQDIESNLLKVLNVLSQKVSFINHIFAHELSKRPSGH